MKLTVSLFGETTMRTIKANLSSFGITWFTVVAIGYLGFHVATGLVQPIL